MSPRILENYSLASGMVTTEEARLIDGSQPDETTVEGQQKTSEQGLKLVDMDIEKSFIDRIQHHAAECRHPLVKVAAKNVRKGFELIATYS
jgi:hypothetical protein